MKTLTLDFVSDPSHGWLIVHPNQIKEILGEKAKEISEYSFRKLGWFCLEEDCDASLFYETAKAAGYEVKFNEIHFEGDFRAHWFPKSRAI